MSSQGTLFGMAEARKTPPQKPKPAASKDLSFRRIAAPCGFADKRGAFAYEKFHKAAAGIGEGARVKFFEILQTTDATLFSKMIEIGVLWNRLTVQDQMDYEDAIRLRG